MSRASAAAKHGPVARPASVRSAWTSQISELLSRVSRQLHGYLPAIAAVAAALLLHYATLRFYGPGFPGLYGLYGLAFIVAAWCGYGPGILATLLIVFTAPYLFRPDYTIRQVNPTGLAVYLLVAVVVSAAASGRRRLEALLHSMNAELDDRVKQQTTALELANTTLQHRLAELETLYGKLSVGLCFLDCDLHFVRVNEKFAHISGVAMEAHLNRELRDVVEESLAHVLERICARVLATGEAILDHEINVPGESGGQFWSIDCSAVPSAAGVLGLQIVMQNITERKRSEQHLNQAINELKRANEDLEQFAYSASHDLQESIRTVAIYSQMLKRKFENALGPEGADYIAYTVDNALRLQQLVKDLLAYTQASSPSLEQPDVVSASHAVEQVISNLKPVVTETGARILCRNLPDVRIQKSQLVLLLQNIIGNAIKYRRDEVPEVVIDARPDNAGRWLFAVTDNGIGIDPRYHQQIFGIFKRLHVAAEYSGTGIGLAICRRIVERHEGKIWVDSQLGSGTTVFFTLPGSNHQAGAAAKRCS